MACNLYKIDPSLLHMSLEVAKLVISFNHFQMDWKKGKKSAEFVKNPQFVIFVVECLKIFVSVNSKPIIVRIWRATEQKLMGQGPSVKTRAPKF